MTDAIRQQMCLVKLVNSQLPIFMRVCWQDEDVGAGETLTFWSTFEMLPLESFLSARTHFDSGPVGMGGG